VVPGPLYLQAVLMQVWPAAAAWVFLLLQLMPLLHYLATLLQLNSLHE
jgi:hypothetical protein